MKDMVPIIPPVYNSWIKPLSIVPADIPHPQIGDE